MFGKHKEDRSLSLPPIAQSNSQAVEILRVWAVPRSPQQVILRTAWKDPAAWGLLLVDVARHASQAYGRGRRWPLVTLVSPE